VVATVEELAALVHGRLVGDGTVAIRSARPVGEAGPGDITFTQNGRFAQKLHAPPAAAARVDPHFKRNQADRPPALIEVADPMQAFLAVRSHLGEGRKARWTGIHPQACVAPTATIGENVAIYPFA